MKIHYNLDRFDARKPVVTIGTFDGVHLGHRKVISRLKEFARSHDGESVIFTFYPHPRLITAPDETNLRLLTTLKEKEELFALSGIDHLIVFPFTKEFSQLSYSEFIGKLGKKGIALNRKTLADLAMNHPEAFRAIVEKVKQ